jgi:hypothetical protein
MFSLTARVCVDERTVSANADDLGGITVRTSSGLRHARTISQALHIARDDLGPFLARGQRRDVPWGLSVTVAGVSAYYGDVRFLGRGGGGGLPSNQLVVRIRRQWHDGQGPIAALDNALKIVRAYTDESRGRHAA